MPERVSLPASLGELDGRGYLAVETEGYRRAEGVFFTQLSARGRCLRYMVDGLPAVYRGALIGEDGSERLFTVEVYVRGVTEQGGRLRVEIQALGSY